MSKIIRIRLLTEKSFFFRFTIEVVLRKRKFNIKKPHQKNSGGVFGGEPINFD